jgi:tetratricopeptide (TPR) repeat protein
MVAGSGNTRPRPLWLVVVMGVALALEALGALGWWCWHDTRRQLAATPDIGATRLAESACLALPPAVEHSRRLISGDLRAVSLDLVPGALRQLARHQGRWTPVNPVCFKNQAQACILEDDTRGGRDALDQALARDPTSPYLHRFVAVVLRRSGYPEQFLDHLAQARALTHDSPRTRIELTPEDELRVAHEALQRRVELYPRHRVETLLELAAALRKQGDDEQANAVLAPVRSEPMVRLAQARLFLTRGDTGAALAEVEELATRRRYPRRLRAAAWSLLAQARDLEDDHDAAVAAAATAVRLDPRSPAPFLALAAMAERRGDAETAFEHLSRAWGMALTDVNLLLRVARVAEQAGKPADARMALERAASLASDRPEVGAQLVDFYIRHRDFERATLQLTELLDRFPTNPQLLRMTGRIVDTD